LDCTAEHIVYDYTVSVVGRLSYLYAIECLCDMCCTAIT